MKKYFYAYHGPNNKSDFEPSGGYGVAQEYKQKQTKVGDLVYVIQKNRLRDFYELCGLYEITGHYYQEKNKRPYRIRLANVNPVPRLIALDEEELSRRLPKMKGDERWSNFQRHFCRQGLSFQSPLDPFVASLLDELVEQYAQVPAGELYDLEAKFGEQLNRAIQRTPEERRERLSQANRLPGTAKVSTKVFLRNPDVVAEVLYEAQGRCQKCNKIAPFRRRTDNSHYLEVHHKVRLVDGGEDTVDNAIAVCPNCHRELHFGV
ncbi:HNH endonuclease [Halomonas sp. AOP22-C1-8]|uniref:HNH endonuclease n=1 Tax=Halomonas sp. AOP22-C1-8 TaxID=3457717 RepID=UPI00403449DB